MGALHRKQLALGQLGRVAIMLRRILLSTPFSECVRRWIGLREANSHFIPSIIVPGLSIWLAVPKKRVSHMKKRRKATLRDRIMKRKDIIFDPRTGERTLRHRLPENWKEYLPDITEPTSRS